MRGCTLRFIGKLKEPELLEPLVPSIKENLAHRHPYVRKNAAMAIHVLHSALGEALIPDAAESMHEFLLEVRRAAPRPRARRRPAVAAPRMHRLTPRQRRSRTRWPCGTRSSC